MGDAFASPVISSYTSLRWHYPNQVYGSKFCTSSQPGSQAPRLFTFLSINNDRKNVNEKAGIIDAENTKLLEKYHLEYEEGTPDNWDYGCVL